MLLLDNELQMELFSMVRFLPALEEALRAEALGAATNRGKSMIHMPTAEESLWYRYTSMEGGVAELGTVAVRIKSDMVRSLDVDGKARIQNYCIEPGSYCGLILLYSAASGEPLAILNDGYIQHVRVGATYALAAKYMASTGASVLGILGSGGQAEAAVEAMSAVIALEEVRVFSPTRSHCVAFADRMSKRLDLDVRPYPRPEDVVKGVDIVAACTDANEPVLLTEWLEPGMHASAVTIWEVDRGIWDRIHRWIRYPSERTEHHYTAPSSSRPLVAGGFTQEVFEWAEKLPASKRSTLDQVIAGIQPGRESDDEITFYCSEGSGVQFAVAASLLYAEAVERGVGRELPTEWFLESIRD